MGHAQPVGLGEDSAPVDFLEVAQVLLRWLVVVIASQKALLPMKAPHDGIVLADVTLAHITEMVHLVMHADGLVPHRDHAFVHFINGREVPHATTVIVEEGHEVCITKMRVADEPDVSHWRACPRCCECSTLPSGCPERRSHMLA